MVTVAGESEIRLLSFLQALELKKVGKRQKLSGSAGEASQQLYFPGRWKMSIKLGTRNI